MLTLGCLIAITGNELLPPACREFAMAMGEGRYVDFRTGKGTLPEVSPGEVRLVEVMLDLDDDLDPWLIHVEYHRYPVLENGHRDQASIKWEFDLIRAVVGMPSTTQPASPERRLASRQLASTFEWTPTPDEVRALADVVSRKAKRPVLGGTPLRLLDGSSSLANARVKSKAAK